MATEKLTLRLMRVLVLTVGFLAFCLSAFGQTEDEDCVRGMPESVIDANAPGIDKHSFKELPKRKALETVSLKDGLQLRVHHYGCSHYGLTFEFMVDTAKAENGLTLLREVAHLLERLAEADQNSDAVSFLEYVKKVILQQSYEAGDMITIIDDYSWIAVTEETDSTGQRWVQLAYDIAL